MKRITDQSSIINKKKLLKCDDSLILQSLTIYILQARFGKKRIQLFQNQIRSHGGIVYDLESNCPPEAVTYVLLEETITKNILTDICNCSSFKNAKFLKCSWLIKSLKTKTLWEPNEEEIVLTLHENKCRDTGSLPTKNNASKGITSNINCHSDKNTCIDEVADIKEEELVSKSVDLPIPGETTSSNEAINKQKPTHSSFDVGSPVSKFKDKFACAHSSLDARINPNKFITDELEKLASAYKSQKDTWRAVGYQKAIAALKNYPKEIETWEEAKNIRGVGQRLADKIKEIMEMGKLRKVTEICENEETKTLKLFMGVWGAGATTANDWYMQGFRTLEDLKTKANLTRHQKIGLQYYDDINDRMDRSEVEKIETQVRNAAETVKTGLEVTVCGSYRRGKSTCGDVDVLITHPDGFSHEHIFKPLLEVMRKTEFLTDDLVVQDHNGSQQKYLGVCKLPGSSSKHRRLDIIVVPYKEYAPAITYFTGSAHFNRSMRLLATKMGMSLSEHGLRKNIVRDGKDFVTGGILLDTPTEESIFNHLGLEYRAPSERNH